MYLNLVWRRGILELSLDIETILEKAFRLRMGVCDTTSSFKHDHIEFFKFEIPLSKELFRVKIIMSEIIHVYFFFRKYDYTHKKKH